MERVRIFDTTLRDGEQAPGFSLKVEEKLQLAHALDELGVDIIEAGFPIASPADGDAVRRVASDVRRPVVAGLARCRQGDIERVAWALEPAATPRIHTFIATSDLHLEKKLQITRQQCLDSTGENVTRARSYVDDVEFSAEDALRSDVDFLCQVIDVAIKAGATTINLPDTVGYSTPDEIRDFFQTVIRRVNAPAGVVYSAHCHDDLGLAVANTLTAVEAGVRQIECTINGIGERAGNAALEEIVMAMRVRPDRLPFTTGIDTKHIYRTSQMLGALTGQGVQVNKAIVGRNAFAHEAGIHQAGMLKDRRTYEIMRAEDVGVPWNPLVLGKHSGRAAVQQKCKDLGLQVAGDELVELYRVLMGIADDRKIITDADLIGAVQQVKGEAVSARA
ncbi:MAG: 2-isopropylmalate synthase [Vicinamibacterales bacterium]